MGVFANGLLIKITRPGKMNPIFSSIFDAFIIFIIIYTFEVQKCIHRKPLMAGISCNEAFPHCNEVSLKSARQPEAPVQMLTVTWDLFKKKKKKGFSAFSFSLHVVCTGLSIFIFVIF